MPVLSILTHEPRALLPASPRVGLVPTSSSSLPSSSPSPLWFQASVPPPNGPIQTHTILEIALGLVGFVILIAASYFIFGFPCSRRRQPHAIRQLRYHNLPMNGLDPRSRPPIQHVEQTVVSMFALSDFRIRSYDHYSAHPPAYEPRPPPYSEAPQHLHPPPRAIIEA